MLHCNFTCLSNFQIDKLNAMTDTVLTLKPVNVIIKLSDLMISVGVKQNVDLLVLNVRYVMFSTKLLFFWFTKFHTYNKYNYIILTYPFQRIFILYLHIF